MDNDQLLILFGALFMVTMALLIVVPYLRGKSDLLTGRNFFLAGAANFIGVSAIGAGYAGEHMIDYDPIDYYRFVAGNVVFFTILSVAYSYIKLPRKIAGRFLLKWPPETPSGLFLIVPFALAMSLGAVAPVEIPFISQVALQIGLKSVVIALALVFIAWYKQPQNPMLLGGWLAILLGSLILGIMSGSGRRMFVATIITIPLCLYWLRWRYRRPIANFFVGSIAFLIFFLLVSAYTQIRHRNRGETRTVAYSVESLKIAASRVFDPELAVLLGQNCAEYSMLSTHMFTNDEPQVPFHSLIFVLVNPLPRYFWPDKPEGLGRILSTKSQEIYDTGFTKSTWGPGVVGHGYHEGGLWSLAVYGLLVGLALRWFDEMLMRQPGNPYFLAFFATTSSHIIGWTRGDIGTFTIQITAGFIAILVIRFVGRIFLGTGLEYPRSSEYDVTRTGFVLRN